LRSRRQQPPDHDLLTARFIVLPLTLARREECRMANRPIRMAVNEKTPCTLLLTGHNNQLLVPLPADWSGFYWKEITSRPDP
jgi:hypothetical protein